MTAKLVTALLLLILTGILTFFCLTWFTDTVEELVAMVDEIIIAGKMSLRISAFYEMEEFFEENELWFTILVHDTDVSELRECMAEIRGCFFGDDPDGAMLTLNILRQKLVSLVDSVLPSVGNIM